MSEPAPPPCSTSGCESPSSFRLYDPGEAAWRPLCHRHALAVHPSLEIHALLESGYLRPVELPAPEGPPTEPPTERGRLFRASVEALLGWSS